MNGFLYFLIALSLIAFGILMFMLISFFIRRNKVTKLKQKILEIDEDRAKLIEEIKQRELYMNK